MRRLCAIALVAVALLLVALGPMDPNALYAALNTVAQCAAALAALIGFLGLWRLDRLRAEQEEAERDLRGLLNSPNLSSTFALLTPRPS
jgi:hypothetical protein